MNKQNEFYENEISTGIHDSCSKTTYSSKFIQSQKMKNSFNETYKMKKVLPSRYQKSATMIQRWWRFRQHMKRRVCEKILLQLQETSHCYLLQNRILSQLLTQHQSTLTFNQSLLHSRLHSKLSPYEHQISQIKKQCVLASFKLQKKNPKRELLSELVHKKQEQKELNLLINREKLILEEELEENRRENQMLMQEYKRLNEQRLQVNREKHLLKHRVAERMLQTSKFGRRNQQHSSS